jgi:hypothetical protein
MNSVKYSTNKEYRKAIREFCKMNCEKTCCEEINCEEMNCEETCCEETCCEETCCEDIDDETRDELMFDSLQCQLVMNEIFEKTKNHRLWQNIYDKTAAKFFSTDREIGLSVLFCYDFFPGFHDCWKSFLEYPEKFDETNEYYQTLIHTI